MARQQLLLCTARGDVSFTSNSNSTLTAVWAKAGSPDPPKKFHILPAQARKLSTLLDEGQGFHRCPLDDSGEFDFSCSYNPEAIYPLTFLITTDRAWADWISLTTTELSDLQRFLVRHLAANVADFCHAAPAFGLDAATK